jgi:peptidoglycan/LPS O-acetylase OafA/YrhL
VVGHLELPRVIFRGAFGVDLFFVLSGVVISFNYLEGLKTERPFGPAYRDYLAKRLARIYPLHLVTFLIVVGLVWLSSVRRTPLGPGTLYTPFAALLNLTLMHAWGFLDRPSWHLVSWSLSAEWAAYLLFFPVCVYGLERCTRMQAALIVTAIWVAFAIVTPFIEHRSITNVTHDGILRILPEFMAGYLLCRIVLAPRTALSALGEAPPWAQRLGLLLLIAGWLAFWPISWQPGTWDLLVLPAVLAILWGLLHGGPFVNAVFGNRVAVFLGETSFALYMLHLFSQLVGNHVMRRHPAWNTQAHAVPVLLAEVALSYLLATGIYYAVERPARRGTLTLLRRAFPAALALPGDPRRPSPSA